MPLTEAQINAAYIALGIDAVWPLRGNLNEVLGLYPGSNGTAGAAIAYSTTGPESSRSGNVATFSGATNSYADLGSLANVGSRVAAGGGFTFGFWFKIASGVTSWRIGTINGNNGGQYLYYDSNPSNNQVVYRRNNVESSYIDSAVTWMTAQRDNNWHHLGATYDHLSGVWRTFLDGEPFNDGFGGNRNTANDALAVNVANFMLGCYSFNTAPNSYFAGSFAEFFVASKCMSDEEFRKAKSLGVATFQNALDLPNRVGPQAESVANQIAIDLDTKSPLVIIISDSTLTSNGQGYLALPEVIRGLNQQSRGRLSNLEIRIGDAADANAPPGRLNSIASGATAKYLATLRTGDVGTSDPIVGSDNSNRRSYMLDGSQGLTFTAGFRKESGGRGPITYVIRGSAWIPGANPLAGSENYQTIIASGTAFTAGELTGDGIDTAYKTFAVPATSRYRAIQIEFTNTGGSTSYLVDLEVNSIANATGPAIKTLARGGYHIGSFYGNHPNWARMVKNYRAFKGSPPLHAIVVLAPNDGTAYTPTGWYTAFSLFAGSFFADFPDATLTFVLGAPTEGTGAGAQVNWRMQNMLGAVKEYAETFPTLKINGGNAYAQLYRELGWTPVTQSTACYNIVGEYSPATTYAQYNVVWARTNDAGALKRYFLSRFNSQTGVSLLNQEKYIEVLRYLVDGTHAGETGQLQYAKAIVRAATSSTSKPKVWNSNVWANGNNFSNA